VWVANSLDLTVMKIDPATERVIAIIPVGDGPSTLVAGGNSLWVSDEFDATLDRIDLRTARVINAVRLGSSPRGMAVAGSGVWIAARPFPSASHRGGTLTVVDTVLPLTDRWETMTATTRPLAPLMTV
jgi:YVTN family beta-propeller protein